MTLVQPLPDDDTKEQQQQIDAAVVSLRIEEIHDPVTGAVLYTRKRRGGIRGTRRRGRSPADEIYDYEYHLANAWANLEESSKVSQRTKEIVSDFMSHLAADGMSVGRQAKILNHLRLVCENLGFEVESVTKKDIERLMIKIRAGRLDQNGKALGKKYLPHTISDYIEVIKRFMKFVRTDSLDRETPFPQKSDG